MVLVVAIGGKFFGAFTGAPVRGMAPRESAALGLLTNTRGPTELIIHSVGPQTWGPAWSRRGVADRLAPDVAPGVKGNVKCPGEPRRP